MSIEEVVYWYGILLAVLLALLIWFLIRRKKLKTLAVHEADSLAHPVAGKPIDRRVWLALRPRAVLTGEMWLKTFIAAFVALCVAVIIVVYVFPLGAAWAASAGFVAVIVIVGLSFTLLD